MKKQTVDTPYKGSYADEMANRKPVSGIVDPRTLPVQFQEEQRMKNILIRLGTFGYSKDDAARAFKKELEEFPKD
jgi:hypothetical protein